ncbi:MULTISPECIES: malate dehydrogenase (quinone) [unclassified Massilia]|uniref:malate dehydrogenase (quinone) n=1 Tax=unclassified Massilia TaxID=2609279 RepID=UPI00177C62DC|nr:MULTISPECIES: malate dehydrogenase (quinone) [unclassified Massilia]MBD8528387.1 malate dehydrogenase (quinone) [Massilia sp. CFBP 13647]MBD8671991.1 malate dehydrogenase (quinone) [Massilia sp. CFBP 13721]
MRKLLPVVLSCSLIAACDKAPPASNDKPVDVVLIGAGVMSATLGTMLTELQPDLKVEMFERLDAVAAESSDAMNNAGTGHSAFMELNYTPDLPDGSIETKKAVDINEQFEVSKQFWAYQVRQGAIPDARTFINNVPHMSFVWGDDNINFLRKRYAALQKENLFKGMLYSEDHAQIAKWAPLVMNGRDQNQKVAATRMEIGTDVNYGTLTRTMVRNLTENKHMGLHLRSEVRDIKRGNDGTWLVTVKDLASDKLSTVRAKFVFVGAGGGALPLLEKSGIPEAKGFGGVPVGGQFLVTNNPALVNQHHAKVYGKASVGSPPMSVPHLDTRIIDGKKTLLFGPFATFSTKFLKNGSWIDLPASMGSDNLRPMMQAGYDNIPLTKYLVEQVMLNPEDRLATLKEYMPNARLEDWTLATAGQRVQIVKDSPKGGLLQFGTEVVGAADGSIVALLGASPGASTAAPIMLKVLKQSAFKGQLETPAWQAKMKEMIPSYGLKLNSDPALANRVRRASSEALGLKAITLDE